jgi:hypothetical protein
MQYIDACDFLNDPTYFIDHFFAKTMSSEDLIPIVNEAKMAVYLLKVFDDPFISTLFCPELVSRIGLTVDFSRKDLYDSRTYWSGNKEDFDKKPEQGYRRTTNNVITQGLFNRVVSVFSQPKNLVFMRTTYQHTVERQVLMNLVTFQWYYSRAELIEMSYEVENAKQQAVMDVGHVLFNEVFDRSIVKRRYIEHSSAIV